MTMKNIFQSATEIKNVLPKGKRFTLVGGCFDLIHVGHIHLLEYAASLEELLVVAVLSDTYARKYKDSLRPIINQKQRARMIASIRFVDFVYISDTSPSSRETLQLLRPDSVVFGEDSNSAEKIEQRMKNIASVSPNTTVRFLPRYDEEEISTSYIINKIRGVTI
ncbi:MAG: adenylyltransferase/cytidyltransferase family protein [Patescibacteria group bacterium]